MIKKSVLILIIFSFIVLIGNFYFFNSKKKDNEVIFWTLQMGDFASYMNEVISDFEAQNPNIKINWIDVPFSEGEKRTLAAVLSNKTPDLINLNPDFSSILAQKGALQEIPDEYLQQFHPALIEAFQYKSKNYAIPWYATSAITIYNKNLFDVSNKLPETYDDLINLSKNLKLNQATYVFMPTISENDTMLKILNKYGINSPEMIASEKTVEIFNAYKELYQLNLIPKESITATHREALEKYMSGNIVFYQGGANFLNMIKENAPSIYETTDVMPQIKGDLGQNDFSLMNFVIPLKATHKQEALKFALFLTNEENQLKLAKLTNILAVNKDALQNEYYTTYVENDLIGKARVISAKQLDNINPVIKQIKFQKELNLVINEAIQSVLLNKINTKSALENVAITWKKLLQN